jgi:hypothetical protein
LWVLGLSGKQVVTHFIGHGIAPLQLWSHLAWEYKGINDPTWLWVGLPATLDPVVLKGVVNELCGRTDEL